MTIADMPLNGKPDYGLDAPRFQRGALYGGVAGVVAGRVLIEHGVMSGASWASILGSTMVWTGLCFFLTGCVMFWGSKVAKLHLRNAILNSIAWRGDEHVLDVGCGHGLMLLGAAKRLESGRAVGVDIWSQKDQKDNSAEATMENAQREGVAERVEVKSANACELPFPDSSFDVIVSTFAIHNISGGAAREKAIQEMARVLKPGGQLALADISHTRQYEKTLRTLGWQQTLRWSPNFMFVVPTRVLRATKPDAHA